MQRPTLQISIIEDDTRLRNLLFASLDAHKIKTEILVFENDMELINYLKKPLTTIPDMVFLKMHLPLQNGMRCVKAFRGQSMLKKAVLVIYAAEATEAEIEEAFVERANIYMNIPKKKTELEGHLGEILKLVYQYKHSNLSVENLLIRL